MLKILQKKFSSIKMNLESNETIPGLLRLFVWKISKILNYMVFAHNERAAPGARVLRLENSIADELLELCR